MIASIASATHSGIDGLEVTVEVDGKLGLPKILIIGLPDQAVKESRDRLRSAINNSGFELPGKRYTVNLAPADIKKEGPQFDLPIAVGLLAINGHLKLDALEDALFIAELALDGSLRPVNGVLSMVLSFAKKKKRVFVARENYAEASLQKYVTVFPVESLAQLVHHLNHNSTLEVPSLPPFDSGNLEYAVKLEDIKGQHAAKRALEVAVSGGHNLLLYGPPGSGKTLIAKSIPSILPPASHEEFLDIVRIYSTRFLGQGVGGLRPFRSPHHTISSAAMVGAGTNPKPGEISLAHNGVLFLDEFPEFPRHVLETLRAPLEDRTVTIARARNVVTYPSSFMLICAMNPCPCGYLGDKEKKCRCRLDDVVRYRSKISGPILDRLDMHVEVARIPHQDLKSRRASETSEIVRTRIERVRKRQRDRYQMLKLNCNTELSPKLIEKYCTLDKEGETILDRAVCELHLSARAYHKILKLARTLADMEQTDQIQQVHIQEAIQYRSLDRDI